MAGSPSPAQLGPAALQASREVTACRYTTRQPRRVRSAKCPPSSPGAVTSADVALRDMPSRPSGREIVGTESAPLDHIRDVGERQSAPRARKLFPRRLFSREHKPRPSGASMRKYRRSDDAIAGQRHDTRFLPLDRSLDELAVRFVFLQRAPSFGSLIVQRSLVVPRLPVHEGAKVNEGHETQPRNARNRRRTRKAGNSETAAALSTGNTRPGPEPKHPRNRST